MIQLQLYSTEDSLLNHTRRNRQESVISDVADACINHERLASGGFDLDETKPLDARNIQPAKPLWTGAQMSQPSRPIGENNLIR
jgi:hypothetical protein